MTKVHKAHPTIQWVAFCTMRLADVRKRWSNVTCKRCLRIRDGALRKRSKT